MKDIVEFLSSKKLIFKKLTKVENRILQTRKKVQIYTGVTLERNYIAVFAIDAKSRFLTKNAFEMVELLEKLKDKMGHSFKKKVLIYNDKICSKAEKYLAERGWKLYASV